MQNSLPVCRVSTDANASVEASIAAVRAFIETNFSAGAAVTAAVTPNAAETDDCKKARLMEESKKEEQSKENVAPMCHAPAVALEI